MSRCSQMEPSKQDSTLHATMSGVTMLAVAPPLLSEKLPLLLHSRVTAGSRAVGQGRTSCRKGIWMVKHFDS